MCETLLAAAADAPQLLLLQQHRLAVPALVSVMLAEVVQEPGDVRLILWQQPPPHRRRLLVQQRRLAVLRPQEPLRRRPRTLKAPSAWNRNSSILLFF
jgi:hypothetical protein